MNGNKALLMLLMLVLLVGCNRMLPENDEINKIPNDGDDLTNEEVREEPIDPIEEILSKLSMDEKIGQLIIAGFEGTELNDEVVKLVDEYKVGGFILFSRNILDENQTIKLLNDIKDLNSKNNIPLFLSIDEEGGRVSRLPKSYVKLPEAAVFGKKNNKALSYELGKILGERVKALGFNMDFSPVLDINSNPKNPVIGNRAFGSNVETVVENGIEAMLGIKETNVISVVKHFPGHGDTSIDSHVNLPMVDKTKDELKSFELVPFINAIENDADAIMIAHILYPKIDSNPATMSSKIIDDLLRNELGFNGIVISDDMTMGAIVENYTLEEAVLSFLKGGGDIALICHGYENILKAVESIKEAVRTGELPEEKINEKVYRILSIKEKYNLKDEPIEDIDLTDINNRTLELINKVKN